MVSANTGRVGPQLLLEEGFDSALTDWVPFLYRILIMDARGRVRVYTRFRLRNTNRFASKQLLPEGFGTFFV
jgi:hypothetical protein